MVYDDSTNQVVRTKLGRQTGDVLYQTVDGRWWKRLEGEGLQTGEEIRRLESRGVA